MAGIDLANKIEVVLPSDFPITMMRTAFVAAGTERSEDATDFLRYLASSRCQDTEATQLPPLQSMDDDTPRAVIDLRPGLMIFLGRMKRKTFIDKWENAVVQ